MKDGILIINKDKNMTSRDVVNVCCDKLKTKHIGHTGTLDPIATGVLVLGVNDGCKIIELLTSNIKTYKAEVIVGVETDTLDVTGEVIKTYNVDRLDNKLEKENGYYTFSFIVTVSKGTYIRSLIRDIGIKLGYSCTMKNLDRIRQGIFSLDQAISLDDVCYDNLTSIADALINYDSILVDDDTSKKVLNGAILKLDTSRDLVVVFNKNKKLLAIYQRYQKDTEKMKPYKVFGGKNEKVE